MYFQGVNDHGSPSLYFSLTFDTNIHFFCLCSATHSPKLCKKEWRIFISVILLKWRKKETTAMIGNPRPLLSRQLYKNDRIHIINLNAIPTKMAYGHVTLKQCRFSCSLNILWICFLEISPVSFPL